jgi:hypothetical protein
MAKVAGGLVDLADLPVKTAFTSLTLENGWTAVRPVEVSRYGDVVNVRGQVSGGSAQTFVTLPAWARPGAILRVPAWNETASAGGIVVVNTTGTMLSAGSRPNTSFNITFIVD